MNKKMNENISVNKKLFGKGVRKCKAGEKVKNINGMLLRNEQEI